MTAAASRTAGGMPPGGKGNDLTALWAVLPHLPDLLEAWRGRTVGEVAGQFGAPGAAPAPSGALIDAMADLAAASMGQGTACALRRRLARTPSVLSANHHAIECFPELAQAVHFFGLAELLARPDESAEPTERAEPAGMCEPGQMDAAGAVPPSVPEPGAPRRVIPVLSCTTVSLQSQVYPRGLMLSRRVARDGHMVRLPLFSAAEQDTMVGAAPPLTAAGVAAMRRRWGQVGLAPWERDAANALVDAHVDRAEVYDLPTFTAQVGHINASLCRARFSDTPEVAVAYVGLETLAARLLERDLTDPGSPVAALLFDGALRHGLLEALAGARACWERDVFDGGTASLPRTGRTGTAFFWWVDDAGRRCPLRCARDGAGMALVRDGVRIPLEPQAITDALGRGRIVPGLFCSYAALVAGHGLRCHGGIFFAAYLPVMLAAVERVLGRADDGARGGEAGGGTCAGGRAGFAGLTGIAGGAGLLAALPLTVLFDAGRGPRRVAGAVEMFAAGGLARRHIEHLAALPMDAVLPVSLRECYMECVPQDARAPGWQRRLAAPMDEGAGVVLSLSR
uniref:Uncharacterized protein n=1 Tax=Nitratidesulfovibrio vulgaris (strain DSM 19637 / Miyazaki F) TaxID=883 RepID=B8DMR0_NITV9